jgi:hypothetical protein
MPSENQKSKGRRTKDEGQIKKPCAKQRKAFFVKPV